MQYAICTRGTSRGIQYTRCKMQGARATSHTNGRCKMQYAPTIITRQQPTTALLLDPRKILVLVLIQLQLLTLHDRFCIRFRFHLGFDVFYKYDAFACWNAWRLESLIPFIITDAGSEIHLSPTDLASPLPTPKRN